MYLFWLSFLSQLIMYLQNILIPGVLFFRGVMARLDGIKAKQEHRDLKEQLKNRETLQH